MARKRKKKISPQAMVLRIIFIIILILLIRLLIKTAIVKINEKKDGAADSAVSDTLKTDGKSSSGSSAVTESGSLTVGESGAISEENMANSDEFTADSAEEIDNAWAMFLVNNNNSLPDDYDKRIKTKQVYSNGERDYDFDERAADYLLDMFAAAKKDGINLTVNSAYRTIEYQQFNFDRSVQQRVNDGMTYEEAVADTEKEVAIPGKSEHNAGLAADIFSDEYVSFDDDGFKNTKAYTWLMENAADYGFILRYPEDKEAETGIIYEPWHYRFVGVYYAHKVKDSGLCLEEYFDENGWLDENGKAIKMTVE